ncbi:uncharacterized protein VTP21DRAFT_1916 [Calcarisporiella thermophila]|uniref:uncharacterized protein n=1 Tax=Calcarisporiella thermophila TaxID=911321 RepID=UPI00374448F8
MISIHGLLVFFFLKTLISVNLSFIEYYLNPTPTLYFPKNGLLFGSALFAVLFFFYFVLIISQRSIC